MMPKVPFLILLVSLNLKGSLYVSATSVCGAPDDPCMNEQNWARCRHLEEVGCENILIMESCPLQFGCNDNGRDKIDNDKEDIKNVTDSLACVTLKKYTDTDCKSAQVAETLFSTFTKPGSPCYHEPGTEYSIKDQYCDFDSGIFHQSIYWGSTDCDETKAPPMEQTYSKSTCLYGYKLGDCYKGACFDESSSSEESITA